MALISLLLERTQKRTTIRQNNSDVDILPIDATIQRTVNFENEITSFPVEEGPDVSDHVRLKPITMTINGVISDTPLTLEAQKASLVTSGSGFANRALGGFKGGLGTTVVGAAAGKLGAKLFQASGSPAEIGRKTLEDLIKSRQRMRIAIGNRILDDMVLTRLSIPEDTQTGQALSFTATFQQLTIVKGQTVLIEKIARSAAHGAKKVNLGAQSTTEANDQQKKASSVLFKVFGG
ncbi:phage baseplate protein [Immundisolibacter sp.]